MRVLCLVILALTLYCGRATPVPDVLYRVNCGSSRPYTDKTGAVWSADQRLIDSTRWGAINGGCITRSSQLPILDSLRPELYRTERYAVECYRFSVPPGFYTLQLHFAETYEVFYRAGQRAFDVAVNDRIVISRLDPCQEAGGFARPCVYEIVGARSRKGNLDIRLISEEKSQEINGIEVLRGKRQALAAHKILGDSTRALPANWDTMAPPGTAPITAVLFVGTQNSTSVYAVPQSIKALVNASGTMRMTVLSLAYTSDKAWPTDSGTILDSIRSGRYGLVVTEGSRTLKNGAPPAIAIAARQANARLLHFSTPIAAEAESWLDKEEYARYGAAFVPVSTAYASCKGSRPDITLADQNGGTTIYSSFLAECVFYSYLTNKKFVGDRYLAVAGQVEIPSAIGEALADLAWRGVSSMGSRKN